MAADPKSSSTPGGLGPVVLALETATACGSVSITAGQKCLAEVTLNVSLTYSRRLLPAIAWLMQEACCTWDAIDAVAVSCGPGSFTGLRIGMSTAKGLAMAAAKRLIGVSTLDALAGQFHSTPHQICPVLDARKNEVYAAFYRCTAAGRPQRLSEYLAVAPERLAAMISEPTILVGDGVGCMTGQLAELGELARVAPAGVFFPRAAALGLLAAAQWQRQQFLDPAEAVPIYVRPSEAEIHFGSGAP